MFFFTFSPLTAQQVFWSTVGPAGGDARAFAAVPGQPNHLYLGSTNSWVYESVNGGATWQRLSKLDATDDLVVDHILVDASNPATVFAAAWRLDQPGGGLWVSRDGGRTWSAVEGLRGQSIRAFASSPSNAAMLFAGTLEGVFRSIDSGMTWTLISPPGSHEIHEIESLAIDPANPDVIYAGTWHLPWKTEDGGKNWKNIKEGIIDDSDVFSIIIDPAMPSIVFASACSGIYKSVNAGSLFKKIEGIPATARRTRVLKQDPSNANVVYAGTTEGLYKTVNSGKTFTRLTDPEVIVNDVFVDPTDANRVLVATDRSGVLLSTDGGASFVAANEGFSGRKVEALLVDPANSSRLFAGVVNDKASGGVFVSENSGAGWQQIGNGLDGSDVFTLAESPEGTILAGTNHGIRMLGPGSDKAPSAKWLPRNTIQNTLVKAAVETHYGMHINIEKQVKDRVRVIDGSVNSLDLAGDAWLASTTGGLFTSKDKGATWQGGPVMGAGDYLSVTSHGAMLAAARGEGVVLSTDAGQTWMPIGIPAMLTRIHRVVFSADGAIWLGAREGVYFSRDNGKTWMWVDRLPIADVDDLFYDAGLNEIFASSRSKDQIFAINAKTLDWKWWKTGYRIELVRATGGRMLAASLGDGVLIEPQASGVETVQK